MMEAKVQAFVDKLNKEYTAKDVNGVAVARRLSTGDFHVRCEFDSHVENYLVFTGEDGQPAFIRDFTITEYMQAYGEPF